MVLPQQDSIWLSRAMHRHHSTQRDKREKQARSKCGFERVVFEVSAGVAGAHFMDSRDWRSTSPSDMVRKRAVFEQDLWGRAFEPFSKDRTLEVYPANPGCGGDIVKRLLNWFH